VNDRVSCIGALLAGAALLVACASQGPQSGAPGRAAATRVTLNATSLNAGRIGQAFLIPEGATTRVVLQVSGVPNTVSPPVHLYATLHRGTCDSLDPQPAYSLTQRVLADASDNVMLTIRGTVPASLDSLRNDRYALSVRTSPADANMAIFCGNLGAA
jgi:hypothetical protein